MVAVPIFPGFNKRFKFLWLNPQFTNLCSLISLALIKSLTHSSVISSFSQVA